MCKKKYIISLLFEIRQRQLANIITATMYLLVAIFFVFVGLLSFLLKAISKHKTLDK
ncbi:hypothetical protein THF1D04_380002 [Vibrio owensii]|uniref:ABC transporter permease n=1 Tax=Vibrio owensii TaxID=696485 RepID=A0AAU9QAF8_9VIBR|nr:hypothetical protein THF1D04_380002 [Vibrio owensii]